MSALVKLINEIHVHLARHGEVTRIEIGREYWNTKIKPELDVAPTFTKQKVNYDSILGYPLTVKPGGKVFQYAIVGGPWNPAWQEPTRMPHTFNAGKPSIFDGMERESIDRIIREALKRKGL